MQSPNVMYNSVSQDDHSTSIDAVRRSPTADTTDCKLTTMAFCVLLIVGISVILVVPLTYSDMTQHTYLHHPKGLHQYLFIKSDHVKKVNFSKHHADTTELPLYTSAHSQLNQRKTTHKINMPHIFDRPVTKIHQTKNLTSSNSTLHSEIAKSTSSLPPTTSTSTTEKPKIYVSVNNITALLRNTTDLRIKVHQMMMSTPKSPSAATIWLISSAALATIIIIVIIASCCIKRRRYLNNRRSVMERVITDLQAADKVHLLNGEHMDT